jgi:hypothetical protein
MNMKNLYNYIDWGRFLSMFILHSSEFYFRLLDVQIAVVHLVCLNLIWCARIVAELPVIL